MAASSESAAAEELLLAMQDYSPIVREPGLQPQPRHPPTQCSLAPHRYQTR